MALLSDRQSRKRLAMRQVISDTATRLFHKRGFDNVTVDDIAAAADVGRMTVFNHFARKEDLFFDLDDDGRELLRTALQQRDPQVSPIETLRLLAHQLVAEHKPFVEFSSRGQAFMETIERSPTLSARARAIQSELTEVVATAMAEGVGREPTDRDVHLAAHLLLATWASAFILAHRTFGQTQDTEAAQAVFLSTIDQGSTGVKAAMAGTPYA